MSKTKAATTPEQSPQAPPSANGTTREPAAEPCAGASFDETETAALAHRLWLDRGCPEGSPEHDWFLAERELRQRARQQAG